MNKHNIIGIVGQMNEGKTNLLCSLIEQYKKAQPHKTLYCYGLHPRIVKKYNLQIIGRREEIEHIKNGVFFLDEFETLLRSNNRKETDNLKLNLRQLHHNNNEFILCGLPFDFRQFICEFITLWYIKKCTIKQLVNGSSISDIAKAYRGTYRSSSLIDIPKDKVLIIDELSHTSRIDDVKYIVECDTKREYHEKQK